VEGGWLLQGDNLDVMRRLLAMGRETFRCAYLDPPFNTGRSYAEYDDARSASEWLAMMRPRLALVRDLLREDGVCFVEIDDTELGALRVVMDEVFGRANRIAIVTIVRSAATGHKAINVGPVNVTDFLLVYAKDRKKARLRPLVRARRGYDDAYRTFLDDPSAPLSSWRFEPLAERAARAMGFAKRRDAVRAIGRVAFAAEVERFALEHATHVVRFAQPRYEAVSAAARKLIDRSKRTEDVLRLTRAGYKDLLLYRGNRILFLADKVRTIDGTPRLVEPLTNVWDDLGFQGISREGGVTFVRNKKPERLLQRVLELATEEGDWVIDPFAGSGTTAAVAHKMRRRWVAIEKEKALYLAARARLERVVEGQDGTGITRAVGWKGGGRLATRLPRALG
jgi:adenine-specific DNA-methyltransferase